MSQCLCEFLSTVWMQLIHRVRSPEESLDSLLERLASQQVQIELQDRRCVSEARRHRESGMRALFQSKMLEHRRLQAQMLQLQRYRENVSAQRDALSHHEINQTFMRAMACNKILLTRKEEEDTISDIQESMSTAKEMTELLGQPIDTGLDVDDEELEQEFLESLQPAQVGGEVWSEASRNHGEQPPTMAPAIATATTVLPTRELVLPPMMMA